MGTRSLGSLAMHEGRRRGVGCQCAIGREFRYHRAVLWLGDDAAHLRFPWVHGCKCFVSRVAGWQQLAWSMRVRARRPLTLLVPLPVLRGEPGPVMRVTVDDLAVRDAVFPALERGFPGVQSRRWSVAEPVDLGEDSPTVVEFDIDGSGAEFTPEVTLAADRAGLAEELGALVADVPVFADWGFACVRIPRGDWRSRTLGLAF